MGDYFRSVATIDRARIEIMKRILFAFSFLFLSFGILRADITSMAGSGGGGSNSSSGDNMGAANFNNLPSTGIIPGPISLTSATANIAVVLGSGTYNNITSSGPSKFQHIGSTSIFVGTSTIINRSGIYSYGKGVFNNAASSSPLWAIRPNTEGDFLVMQGDNYLYGSLRLVPGGITISTGADSDTVGTYSKWFGISIFPPGAKLHVFNGLGNAAIPGFIVSTGGWTSMHKQFEVGGTSVVAGTPFYSSGTVTAPNYHVNRDSVFYSTFQANRYDGYVTIVGSITALGIGESHTFTPDGFTSIEIPVVTELAGGAEANQVRVTAITANSFTIKNHSAIATKDVYFWCLGRR